ncbi:amidase [Pseudonocardia sp. RS010]|uniref:amidase n=1 Tax=Pseudonocardia sp. RS010 TaxID=3385979 RepID=UPI0039A2DBA4
MADSPLTLSDALRLLDTGAISSVELTEAALAAADRDDATLGVFVSRFPERARAAARAADEARARGSAAPLLGVPIGIKDIITTEDGETTGQSLVLDRAWGAGDAAVAARLRAAGAVVVGKTTTMEFALGDPDPTKPFPIPRNPWDPTRWAGGSSSGSGSGVAAGMFLGALGTDTGASVRMPSALCGITGLKPTYGRVPKSGVIPLGYSLDHVGPMARSAEDCARLLGVLVGRDAADPTSVDGPPFAVPAAGDLSGLRIGYDPLHAVSGAARDLGLDALTDAALDVLRERGATVVPVTLPLYSEVTAACAVSIIAEAAAYHAPDLRDRWADYFASTRAGLGMAAFVSAADYVQAQRVRRAGQVAVAALFAEVDVLASPTVAAPAPPVEAAGGYVASLFAGTDLAYLTAYWNALGNPALSVPTGFSSTGLPLALQLVGPAFADETVLRVGASYQERTDWHLARPEPAPAPLDRPSAAAPPAGLPEPSAGALAMLEQAALGIGPDELAALAAALPMVRANAERLRDVPGTRYADPVTVFRA